MNSNREETLFALALEKPADKRPAFLDVMCEGDSALRQRLEALLAAHDETNAALATAAPDVKATMKLEFADAPDEAVGQTLRRYKLLERVGEGGCGVVYVAEQTEPVRRRVALKVIKLGMDNRAGAQLPFVRSVVGVVGVEETVNLQSIGKYGLGHVAAGFDQNLHRRACANVSKIIRVGRVHIL